MNMRMISLNFNKKGPYSRRGFRNELNLLEQICLRSVFFESEPTMNYSPYRRFTSPNLDKILSRASFLQCHRVRPRHAND